MSQTQAKKALVSGITGQAGSYLAELLLSRGYEVYGIIRRSSLFNTGRIDLIYQDPHVPNPRLRLLYGDLNDASSLNKILRTLDPTKSTTSVRKAISVSVSTSPNTPLR